MNDIQKERQVLEWLEDYQAYKAGIENLQEIVEDVAEADMGVSYDKEPSGKTNKFSSTTENAAIELSKFNIEHRLKVMNNIVNYIDKGLNSLTETEREVIVNRCMKRQYYYQFCYKIYVSERTAKRIKKEALHKMVIVIFGKE